MNNMQISRMILGSAAILSIAACNADKAAEAKNVPEATSTAVPAPKNGDWSKIVTKTPEGGFLMGNPNAKVKLVEFGSLTCGHCAAFEEQGGEALVDNYVKKGLVSWEFRNMIHDPFDMTAALLARCGGEANFFGLARNLYADQKEWIGKIQAADPAKMQSLQAMPPAQQFSTIADVSGLKQYAATRGVSLARSEQCLADEAEVDRLVQMNTDATISYGNLGTPSFLINGVLVEKTHSWDVLEPKIKEALAS
jgi:protein-disulfide isomerase